ncbi:protein-disulfide reductase DsbD [Acuticoccus mangrovi]|uniref:Protein-disulfide reductase DsbD n=1 Tax=Acuticoccus mangrovi TaxID=2796142 RepID=A0A934INL7_9HYPH|nr:protein-disulfide reductase DsbD [Acuticoccus mangrovi]MBJ3775895.1 protein-disulfide reductase DsbD [Acuticoccus mangrovi]
MRRNEPATAAILVVCALCLLIGTSPGAGAETRSPPLAASEAFAPTLSRSADGGVAVRFEIADGYYLYRDGFAVGAQGASLPFAVPDGETKDDPTFGPSEVYHDGVSVTVAGAALAGLSRGADVTLRFRGCQEDGICYRPQAVTFDPERLLIASGSSAADALSPLWTRAAQAPTAADAVGAANGEGRGMVVRADPAAGGVFDRLFLDVSAPMVVATFFVLGLGLAFTPCVFPMYPILAGQLTRGGGKGMLFGLTHSLAYVVAMAAAFGLIGLVAAWSGANLQRVLQSPVAIGAVATLFALLALSMFGLFELRLPGRLVAAVSARSYGHGLGASAALGFTSTLIVGPCVTAPLAGALLYIAQTGDAGLGAASLFALGLGQGAPLVLFGTAGARLLPRAGAWMTVVTRAFGVAFLGLALFMASRILPPTATLWLAAALVVGVGVALIDAMVRSAGWMRQLAATSGVLAIVVGAVLAVGAMAGATDPLRPLAPLVGSAPDHAPLDFRTVYSGDDLAAAVAQAAGPTFLYFTAEWCVSCTVMERSVFADADVITALGRHTLLKVDLTDEGPATAALMHELAVVGPPTMLFIAEGGAEVPATRVVGEVGPDAVVSRARKAAF